MYIYIYIYSCTLSDSSAHSAYVHMYSGACGHAVPSRRFEAKHELVLSGLDSSLDLAAVPLEGKEMRHVQSGRARRNWTKMMVHGAVSCRVVLWQHCPEQSALRKCPEQRLVICYTCTRPGLEELASTDLQSIAFKAIVFPALEGAPL